MSASLLARVQALTQTRATIKRTVKRNAKFREVSDGVAQAPATVTLTKTQTNPVAVELAIALVVTSAAARANPCTSGRVGESQTAKLLELAKTCADDGRTTVEAVAQWLHDQAAHVVTAIPDTAAKYDLAVASRLIAATQCDAMAEVIAAEIVKALPTVDARIAELSELAKRRLEAAKALRDAMKAPAAAVPAKSALKAALAA